MIVVIGMDTNICTSKEQEHAHQYQLNTRGVCFCTGDMHISFLTTKLQKHFSRTRAHAEIYREEAL